MSTLNNTSRALAAAALVAFSATPALAGASGLVSGQYVEARTAEVFTGGCIMGSEAETVGRQAVLAWRIDHGSVDGVSLDGLSVVAAIAGERNLGIREMGGEEGAIRSTLIVDGRATDAQRAALVALARDLAHGLIDNLVEVTSAPITFERNAHEVSVTASHVELAVHEEMTHDPSCGAMQWFHPLAAVSEATVGVATSHVFNGSALGTKWSDPNKRSAFFGTFSY